MPIGGLKENGLGKEGSRQVSDAYIETKYVCIGGAGTLKAVD